MGYEDSLSYTSDPNGPPRMPYGFQVPIGDWSGDGHSQIDIFIVRSTLPKEQLQDAYLESCEKTGFRFHGAQALDNRDAGSVPLFADFESNMLTAGIMALFRELGCPAEALNLDHCGTPSEEWVRRVDAKEPQDSYDGIMTPKQLLQLILWFMSLSLPSTWHYEIVEDNFPLLWGYSDDRLNIVVGYGLY